MLHVNQKTRGFSLKAGLHHQIGLIPLPGRDVRKDVLVEKDQRRRVKRVPYGGEKAIQEFDEDGP
jgi:hypothetical protein